MRVQSFQESLGKTGKQVQSVLVGSLGDDGSSRRSHGSPLEGMGGGGAALCWGPPPRPPTEKPSVAREDLDFLTAGGHQLVACPPANFLEMYQTFSKPSLTFSNLLQPSPTFSYILSLTFSNLL